MAESADYRELARRYGLAPIPESVLRLTELVARQDSDLEQIAQLIAKDSALQSRLLRLANPDAASLADYDVNTVEEALFQRGVGCALLLAMGSPLAFALAKTFQTMLGLKLETAELGRIKPLDPPLVVGTIGFSGKTSGNVCLRMETRTAEAIAARILGLDSVKGQPPGETDDAVGELLNIITGNFKSNLCDAGLDCRLEPPKIWRAPQGYKPVTPAGGLERMAFCAGSLVLLVDVAVNPWNQE